MILIILLTWWTMIMWLEISYLIFWTSCWKNWAKYDILLYTGGIAKLVRFVVFALFNSKMRLLGSSFFSWLWCNDIWSTFDAKIYKPLTNRVRGLYSKLRTTSHAGHKIRAERTRWYVVVCALNRDINVDLDLAGSLHLTDMGRLVTN